MSSVAAIDCTVADRPNISADRDNCSLSSFKNFTISQQRSFDISLSTTDSDRVTIHSSSQFEASFSAYNRSGLIDVESVGVSARSFVYGQARNFSLSVEGSLDREEARMKAKK